MSYVLDEIRAVDREHALGLRPLTAVERDRLRERIRSRYGGGSGWMWETATKVDALSVQDGDAWEWISGFVGSRECILLFDSFEEVDMFHMPSGRALEILLANSFPFEFYVTDWDASYLICFNHHDVIVCWGPAKEWLEAMLSEADC